MALLRVDGLSFAYPYAARRTLNNVSFEMAEGEYLVLCGPSGCGKTTLLKQVKKSFARREAGSGGFFIRIHRWKRLTRRRRLPKSAMSSKIRRIRS